MTGGSGYIGRHLLARLGATGRHVRATRRNASVEWPEAAEWIDVGDIGPETDWRPALRDVELVVHLAGRAHKMRDSQADSLAAFRHVNTAGTERLARSAGGAGVRRMLFVSSVKVNGERTDALPFTETDSPRPEDPYGISKLEAEQAVMAIADETTMEVVIVRPPLVCGPDAPGNFARLLRAVSSGLPLPFGGLHNRRSLVNVENLVDFLMVCGEHPHAAGEIFLVSDGEDISTADLVRVLAEGMNRRPRLVPVPESLLRLAGRLTGRADSVDRLCSSLQVSTAKAREMLGWRAPVGAREGLASAARLYRAARAVNPP